MSNTPLKGADEEPRTDDELEVKENGGAEEEEACLEEGRLPISLMVPRTMKEHGAETRARGT